VPKWIKIAFWAVTIGVCPFLPGKWVGLVVAVVGALLALALWPWSLVRRALQASDSPRSRGHLLRLIGDAIGSICFLNSCSIFIDVWILGGDAWSGCIENGHYYLSPHPGCHMRIEVSHAVFQYSLWRLRSMLITGPAIVMIYIVGPMLRSTRVVRQ
jgi:hypothetical protein